MRVRMVGGSKAGEAFAVGHGGATMGRGETCQIVLDDVEASREHARVYVTGDGYVIEDLKSTNGVFLNDRRVEGRQPLASGDRIRIGTTLMVVEEADGGKAAVQLTSRSLSEETAEQPALPSGFRPARQPSLLIYLLAVGAVLLVAAGIVWVALPGHDQTLPPNPYASEAGATAEVENAAAAIEPEPPAVDDAADPENRPAPVAADDGEPVADPAEPPPAAADPAGEAVVAEPAPAAEPPPAAADPAGEAAIADPVPAAEPPPTAVADAPPAPAPAPLAANADYLWIDSEPSGATVELNSEVRGTTPLVIERLPEGRHQVKLSLADFETASRFFDIPNDGQQVKVTLRQRNATCRLVSTPAGAAVRLGPRLLGTTPLMLASLAPGDYDLTVELPGYATATAKATIDPARPTSVNVPLVEVLGVLRVITIPGGANVLLNNLEIGRTTAGTTPLGPSAVLLVDRLIPGRHRVHAVWNGVASQPVFAELTAEQPELEVTLKVFIPNMRFKMKSGKETSAMQLGEDTEAFLALTARGALVRVPRDQVESATPIALAEGLELLKQLDAGGGQ